jgi:hypothetical protein
MEKEFNVKLKQEVNDKFDTLFRKIGNNRQQLATKVVAVQHAILKELNKSKVEEGRQREILREVAETERMAAKQLPHVDFLAKPAGSPAPPPAVKSEPSADTTTPKPKAAPAKAAATKSASGKASPKKTDAKKKK